MKPLPEYTGRDVSTSRNVGLDVVLRSAITPSEMAAAKEIARKMFEKDMARLEAERERVQNLNAALHPALRALLKQRRQADE